MKKRFKIALLAGITLAIMSLFTGCANFLGALADVMTLEGTWKASDSTYNYEYVFETGETNHFEYRKTRSSTDEVVDIEMGTWNIDFDAENDMSRILVIGENRYPEYKLTSDTLKLTTDGLTFRKQQK